MLLLKKFYVFDKNQKNRFKSKKSDLNQINPIFLIFLKKSWFFCNPGHPDQYYNSTPGPRWWWGATHFLSGMIPWCGRYFDQSEAGWHYSRWDYSLEWWGYLRCRSMWPGSMWISLCPPFLTVLIMISVVCCNGIARHSRGVASLCVEGGGGATGVDCGTFVVGGPASPFPEWFWWVSGLCWGCCNWCGIPSHSYCRCRSDTAGRCRERLGLWRSRRMSVPYWTGPGYIAFVASVGFVPDDLLLLPMPVPMPPQQLPASRLPLSDDIVPGGGYCWGGPDVYVHSTTPVSSSVSGHPSQLVCWEVPRRMGSDDGQSRRLGTICDIA